MSWCKNKPVIESPVVLLAVMVVSWGLGWGRRFLDGVGATVGWSVAGFGAFWESKQCGACRLPALRNKWECRRSDPSEGALLWRSRPLSLRPAGSQEWLFPVLPASQSVTSTPAKGQSQPLSPHPPPLPSRKPGWNPALGLQGPFSPWGSGVYTRLSLLVDQCLARSSVNTFGFHSAF